MESISGGKKMNEVTLITLYDTYEFDPKLRTGFGFSCFVHAHGKKILFDTGSEAETLLYNMEQLGIDSKEINTIMLSHAHWDHTGGLSGFLKANNRARVIKPTAFSKSTEIYTYIYSTGYLGGLLGIKEQGLAIKSSKGLVVITGCSHPGIIEIIKRAREIDESIYLVLGGFHLGGASDSELRDIIKNFRELGVEKVAPCHCSGDRTRQLFKEEYKDDFIENGVGNIIEI